MHEFKGKLYSRFGEMGAGNFSGRFSKYFFKQEVFDLGRTINKQVGGSSAGSLPGASRFRAVSEEGGPTHLGAHKLEGARRLIMVVVGCCAAKLGGGSGACCLVVVMVVMTRSLGSTQTASRH